VFFHVPDPDGQHAHQYGEVKQGLLMDLAHRGEFHAYDDAVRFLLMVKAAGVRTCAASSSENADMFLREIAVGAFCQRQGLRYPFVTPTSTLLDLFDADVYGRRVAHGKPDPELFLLAARQLGYFPAQCFVVEDAPAGIEAAKAGGMLAIGIARHHDEDLLRAVHADIVVTSLDAIDIAALVGN
jgi:beta-phosphoglucomutase-like phosphatase (HAD superfamily)